MPKKSSIRKLPEGVQAELNRMIADGKFTLDELTAWLADKAPAAAVSRSAIGRYSQSFEAVAKELRLVREMSLAMKNELEDVPDGDGGRMIIESLQALLLRARMQLADSDEDLDVEEVSLLARAMKDLQAAMKSNVDTEMKIRDRVTKEAANEAEAVCREKGLSEETVTVFRERLLGLRKS